MISERTTHHTERFRAWRAPRLEAQNVKGNGGRGEDVAFKPDCAEPSRSPICSPTLLSDGRSHHLGRFSITLPERRNVSSNVRNPIDRSRRPQLFRLEFHRDGLYKLGSVCCFLATYGCIVDIATTPFRVAARLSIHRHQTCSCSCSIVRHADRQIAARRG